MPARISPASALVPLADWIEEYGRPPSTKECRPENGLCHYSTYIRHYVTMSAAVSAAIGLDLQNLTSSVVSALRGPQTKPCLQCGKTMRDQGRHIRHCRRCRMRIFETERDNGDEEFSGQVHFGMMHVHNEWSHTGWDDLLDEITLMCH